MSKNPEGGGCDLAPSLKSKIELIFDHQQSKMGVWVYTNNLNKFTTELVWVFWKRGIIIMVLRQLIYWANAGKTQHSHVLTVRT